MAINELLDELEITVDQRLQQFSYPQLLSIVDVLTKRMRIRDLSQLLADQQHFTIKNLLRALTRVENGAPLLHFLNEPLKEQELHQSIEHWLLDQGLHVHALSTPEQNANILGWKAIGYRGRSFTRFWENKELWTIETNLKKSQNAIDQAFSQATDLAQGAHYCYVTITPYIWYKNPDTIRKKMDSMNNIGVLLVDRSRVIKILADAQLNDVDKNRYNALKSALE
jgi:hypothetical protein